MKMNFPPTFALAVLLGATVATPFSAAALIGPLGSLTPVLSGGNLTLSFASTASNYYTLQTCPDLSQPWTILQPGIPGNGTLQNLTINNVTSASQAFYRLLIQPAPVGLLLPQSEAFAILGHSCGGIKEQVSVTGFNPTNGYPIGVVSLSTTCSTGGRGSRPATFTASASVTWDFAGNVISSTSPATASASPAVAPFDAYGDMIYNSGTTAHLIVPVPAAPVAVTAAQSGDQFQVSWTSHGVNPVAIISSTLTATPVNSTAPILTATVTGPVTNGLIPLLQPRTTYQITVVNTTIGGSGPASVPLTFTTEAASIAPSAPAGLTASWSNLNPVGTNDTVIVSWQSAVPGDSPVDQYEITITDSDGGSTFVQIVSGTTLTALFTVDWTPNWSVKVRAHNAFAWGPSSSPVTLGGL